MDAIPLPSSLLFPKRNPELNTGKFFPLLSPQSSSRTKEKGKRENCPKKRQISHQGARLAGLDFNLSILLTQSKEVLRTLKQIKVGKPQIHLTLFIMCVFLLWRSRRRPEQLCAAEQQTNMAARLVAVSPTSLLSVLEAERKGVTLLCVFLPQRTNPERERE